MDCKFNEVGRGVFVLGPIGLNLMIFDVLIKLDQ